MSAPLNLTPREAAALDRLLQAYTGTDESDPGRDELLAVLAKVGRLPQDHAAYESGGES